MLIVAVVSCNGGRHEAVASDSSSSTVTAPAGVGQGTADSTNGAVVTPIDTASSQRRDSSR